MIDENTGAAEAASDATATDSAAQASSDATATGAETAGGGNGTSEKGDGTATGYDWLGGELTDDDRKYLDAKKFDDPRKVYDSLRAAERELRDGDKVALPKDDPLKWDGWDKMGVPAKGEDYDLPPVEVPEGLEGIYGENPDLTNAMRGAMAGARLLPAQAQALYGKFNEFQIAQAQAVADESKRDLAAATTWMGENWGAQKDERLSAAITAAKNLGIEFEGENAQVLDQMALIGGTPQMLAVFDALAQSQAGDVPKGGAFSATGSGATGESAQAQLASFEAKHGASLTNKDTKPEGMTRAQLNEKWTALREAARAEREASAKKK